MPYFILTNIIFIINLINLFVNGNVTDRILADYSTFLICLNIMTTFFYVVTRECKHDKK